jgi:MYXO-CTERM domain-containing protein
MIAVAGLASAAIARPIVNGGFESGAFAPGWVILESNNAPTVQSAVVASGSFAAMLGQNGGFPSPEALGNSSIYQQVTVPAGSSTLSYDWEGYTTDSITFDWQDSYITDTAGTILATIQHSCVTTSAFATQTFDMTPFAGQTVRVEFLCHQDGFGDDTALFVDNVSLVPAPGAAALLGLGGLVARRRRRN